MFTAQSYPLCAAFAAVLAEFSSVPFGFSLPHWACIFTHVWTLQVSFCNYFCFLPTLDSLALVSVLYQSPDLGHLSRGSLLEETEGCSMPCHSQGQDCLSMWLERRVGILRISTSPGYCLSTLQSQTVRSMESWLILETNTQSLFLSRYKTSLQQIHFYV